MLGRIYLREIAGVLEETDQIEDQKQGCDRYGDIVHNADLEDVMGSNTKYSIPSIFFTNVNGVNYLTVMVKDKKSFLFTYYLKYVKIYTCLGERV